MMRTPLASSIFLLCAHGAFAQDPTQHVDPFLGSTGGGNVFVGATLPFGMVKAGPDVGDNTGNAGWLPIGEINGFSQTHVSGTGGGAKYGNILVQPFTGSPTFDGTSSPRSGERASPGRYEVRLDRFKTKVAIAVTRRAALYRFTYPSNLSKAPEETAGLLVDAGHCLSSYPNQNEDQRVVASEIRILSDHAFSGSTSVAGGWNQQKEPYRVFFYAIADASSTDFETRVDGVQHAVTVGANVHGARTALMLHFKPGTPNLVHLKLGISFVSAEQARRNVEQEMPTLDFDRVATAATKTWNTALGSVEIEGASSEQKQIFYTALYHTMLMPTDRTGENPGWQSNEPYYDDFYAIWDTFRSSGPLLTLIAPERQAGMVRALVDMYRHEGWLPDARSGNSNGRTQGGSDAEFLITDAYLKHLPRIDWQQAYAAVKHDAEAVPKDPLKQGRGGLDAWKTQGFLAIEDADRPASRQMEYAADDFEIALLAHALGHTSDADTYLARSRNWEQVWDPTLTDDGVKGFVWPRHRQGSWKTNFNALQTGTWGGDTFYEGNAWTYSLFVPHDVARVIAKSGGERPFVARLDRFFDVPGRHDVGNEPGFLAPYLYLWVGRHDRTADRLREIVAQSYHAGPSGLPGNDDSGAMSSWYAFAAIGIFPNAGQDVYLIGSPLIPKTTLHFHFPGGGTLVIQAAGASATNRYVVSAELNGKPWNKAWFRHADIEHGGTLTLHMAAAPGAWPSGDPPPSASQQTVPGVGR
jgi:predicted alpha-1,2-mannosidase